MGQYKIHTSHVGEETDTRFQILARSYWSSDICEKGGENKRIIVWSGNRKAHLTSSLSESAVSCQFAYGGLTSAGSSSGCSLLVNYIQESKCPLPDGE